MSFSSAGLRSSKFNKLKVNCSRINSVRNFYFNRVVNLWNSLPTTQLDLSLSIPTLKVIVYVFWSKFLAVLMWIINAHFITYVPVLNVYPCLFCCLALMPWNPQLLLWMNKKNGNLQQYLPKQALKAALQTWYDIDCLQMIGCSEFWIVVPKVYVPNDFFSKHYCIVTFKATTGVLLRTVLIFPTESQWEITVLFQIEQSTLLYLKEHSDFPLAFCWEGQLGISIRQAVLYLIKSTVSIFEFITYITTTTKKTD